jgi:hypothetical protein
MQTVIETPAFLASARDEGLDEGERFGIVNYIAAHPDAGDLIPGTGGARKVRFPMPGKGKSGGYRVITFFAAEDIPVFLLDIYSKGSRADLSQSERNELRALLTNLPRIWRTRSKRRGSSTRSHQR